MIPIKSTYELVCMQEGGKRLSRILTELLSHAQPGVSLIDIENHAMKRIQEEGGAPSFTTVEDYQFATCLCINEQVVHASPRPYVLREGDVLTIDIGMIYEGLHTDMAWTKIVTDRQKTDDRGQKNREKEKFLEAGKEALDAAIRAAKAGNRVGDISKAIQSTILSSGYSAVRSLTGHGVGKRLHEEPTIPCYQAVPISRTPLLTAGMTLAIEVIYAQKSPTIVYDNDDGWTLASKDRSLTAVFEHSVAVGENSAMLLTKLDL